ncbi:MAG: VWA domain-containing protein [Bacteroidota bacterium]
MYIWAIDLGMQFKHPEILWAFFLLLIPIIIHLLQLRKFKKTPFTNVALLQKVVVESYKSRSLKKWLLLLSRMLLLAALVLAFSQPFVSGSTALKPKETVIYLDNSFSMQAKSEGLPILERAVQDLLQHINDATVFSLFTNTETYRKVTVGEIQDRLLDLQFSAKQYDLDAAMRKANTLFSKDGDTKKDFIFISDFQSRKVAQDTLKGIIAHYVKLTPDSYANVSIDSAYLKKNVGGQDELTVSLSGSPTGASLPISIYNADQLIAKTAASFTATGKANIAFSLPADEKINGKIVIASNGLGYDDVFYFNINDKEKINVLAISATDVNYLGRIFTEDRFAFSYRRPDQVDLTAIEDQNVIILEDLKEVPNSLQKTLANFKENGGSIIIIPSIESDMESYGQFISQFYPITFHQLVENEQRITSITFDHPLFKDVFEKRVTNFQHPTVNSYYSITANVPIALSFQDGSPFLIGGDGLYLFTAPVTSENSNFKNSPLIVPTFYNMALFSLKNPELYMTVGREHVVDLPITLGKDNMVRVSKNGYEFIPQQQSLAKKTRLFFNENPIVDGIFQIGDNNRAYGHISFNFDRKESDPQYFDPMRLPTAPDQRSIASLFTFLAAESSIDPYWKWFVILALFFVVVETLIQKFVR